MNSLIITQISSASAQSVKVEYTQKDPVVYGMKISVEEYYDGNDKKTQTKDAAAQDFKFIFPEEKTDGKQDGGIQIRCFHKIHENNS